jgi:hypothetical protein
MMGEIARRLGRAALREIGGGGADDHPQVRKLARGALDMAFGTYMFIVGGRFVISL